MNVHLGPVLEEFVQQLIASGYYQSQSEVVRDGLRLLKEQQDIRQARLVELRKEITIGSKEIDQGKLHGGEEVFAEIRKTNAARRKKTQR